MEFLDFYQSNFPQPLTHEEIIENFKLFKNGDLKAKRKLIIHNMRLVFMVAKKFYQCQSEGEDYISIGTIGLIKAINTFIIEKKCKFSFYACRCIENEILMYLKRVNKINNKEISMEESISIDDDGNIIKISDILFDDKDEISMKYEQSEFMDCVYNVFDLLSDKEKRVIMERYINGPKTQMQVAELLNTSRLYVLRIEKKALMKIKNYVVNYGIHFVSEPKKAK